MSESPSLIAASDLLALAENAKDAEWWLWDDTDPPREYGSALALAHAASPAQIIALCNLVRGLASACDAVVGGLELLDSRQNGQTKTIASIRETMERLYEQFPEALGA